MRGKGDFSENHKKFIRQVIAIFWKPDGTTSSLTMETSDQKIKAEYAAEK